jgi:hypothetical protein
VLFKCQLIVLLLHDYIYKCDLILHSHLLPKNRKGGTKTEGDVELVVRNDGDGGDMTVMGSGDGGDSGHVMGTMTEL